MGRKRKNTKAHSPRTPPATRLSSVETRSSTRMRQLAEAALATSPPTPTISRGGRMIA